MTSNTSSVPSQALHQRRTPDVLWWLMALPAFGVGIYAASLQDARQVQDTVPDMPWIDEVHLIAGGIALIIGPFGFRRDLLARATDLHHRLGWIYVLSVLTSGAAAVAMACFSTGGMTTHLGFGILAVLWLSTTLAGVRAIKRRAIAAHRRWMVLSFALCFAAVTLRIQIGPLAMAFSSFQTGYRIVSWSCWVPNLLFAVWWLRRTDLSGQRRRSPSA